MDKMTIYESARGVPKEARKSIGGGRLNGMTDINPIQAGQEANRAFWSRWHWLAVRSAHL